MTEPTKYEEFKETRDKKDREPALRAGVNTGAVVGILSIVAYLWPNLLSEHITTTILIISAFALPVITAIIARRKTWSIASVKEVIDEAVADAVTEMQKNQAAVLRRNKPGYPPPKEFK